LSLSFSFPYQSAVYISFLHYKGNNLRPNPQVLKFPFMQFPPNSYPFLFLGPSSVSVTYCRAFSAHVLRKETTCRIKLLSLIFKYCIATSCPKTQAVVKKLQV
jgi:hypothetical protein